METAAAAAAASDNDNDNDNDTIPTAAPRDVTQQQLVALARFARSKQQRNAGMHSLLHQIQNQETADETKRVLADVAVGEWEYKRVALLVDS